jgi:hypothetical protein
MKRSHQLDPSRALSYPELLDDSPTQTLIISNEIASPLYGPDYQDGNFGSLARRLARQLAPHAIAVYAHERLGSADTAYNPRIAGLLAPEHRQNTIQHEARRIASDVQRIFPTTRQISLLGHSAGAVESIDLARAFHEDEEAASLLGEITVGNLVAFDPPLHHHWKPAGFARYLAYQSYKSLLHTPPKDVYEQAPATPGVLLRCINDTRYNTTAWTRGVAPNLTYVARQMPQTAIHVVLARHSPNAVARLYGPDHYASNIRSLRDGMPTDIAPCNAQVYPGSHDSGSRNAVIMSTLVEAGLISHA